jgi:hypothetical protein
MEVKMDARRKKKITDAIKKISADARKDPDLRKDVAENHIRVLVERGKFNLDDVVDAHDIPWKCPSLSLA